MAEDLAALARMLQAQPRTGKKYTAADLDINKPRTRVTTESSFALPEAQGPYNPDAEPGDPDFDWSTYADYKNRRAAQQAPAMQLGHQFAAEDRAAQVAANNAQQAEGFESGRIPTTFGAGARQHFLEKEPAARNALLSVPALAMGPAGAAAVAGLSPFVGTAMGEASRVSHGEHGIPEGELAGATFESLTGLLGGKAITGAAKGVRASRQFVNKTVPVWLRTPLALKAAGADLAMSEPVVGAMERAGEILTPGGFRGAAANVARGLTPGPQEVGPAVSEFLSPAEALAEAAEWARLRSKWSMADVTNISPTADELAAGAARGPVGGITTGQEVAADAMRGPVGGFGQTGEELAAQAQRGPAGGFMEAPNRGPVGGFGKVGKAKAGLKSAGRKRTSKK